MSLQEIKTVPSLGPLTPTMLHQCIPVILVGDPIASLLTHLPTNLSQVPLTMAPLQPLQLKTLFQCGLRHLLTSPQGCLQHLRKKDTQSPNPPQEAQASALSTTSPKQDDHDQETTAPHLIAMLLKEQDAAI